MKKPTAKKASKKKARAPRAAKRTAVKHRVAKIAKPQQNKAAAAPDSSGKLTFNHAMIYAKDVERGLRFYRDLMGFKLIEDFRYEGTPVYARLRAPGGDGTIALHQAGPGVSVSSDGVRCISKSVISMVFAGSCSRRASTLPNCHA